MTNAAVSYVGLLIGIRASASKVTLEMPLIYVSVGHTA